jgi:rhodanese-related sulfurtransferase
MSTSATDLLERARRRIHRVGPRELQGIVAEGGLVVDIRPDAQRREEGLLPGALIVERNVLEWRFDPNGTHRLPEASGVDQPVVLVCSEGYASSLAAASLTDLGYTRASDLIGGYKAWHAWFEPGPGPDDQNGVNQVVAPSTH